MNIIVSGWPGAGGTTLGLLLSYYLNYTFLLGSETFRFIGTKIGYQPTGQDRIKADAYLEKYWGPVYDKYIDSILQNRSEYIIDSDIAGFRIGLKDNIFSVFLAPSLESRQARLKVDGRGEEAPLLSKREQELGQDYFLLTGVNWLDKESLKTKYNLILDTSNITIAKELETIFEALHAASNENLSTLKIEEDFWSKGKEFYLTQLKSKNKCPSPEEIIRDIYKTFPQDIENMPPELKSIICNL